MDRAIRAAQLTQINALHEERTLVMGIGRGDPTLSVIGEIGITKWRTPTGHTYESRPPPVIRQ